MNTTTGGAKTTYLSRVREVTPRSVLVKREWVCANGSREVELYDQTEAGWERYCAESVQRSRAALARAGAK